MDFNQIFNINSDEKFEALALEVFKFQYTENKVYQKFCDLIHTNVENVKTLEDIPFLPVEFFKSQNVVSGEYNPEITFLSSGTTGQQQSKHHVKNLEIYKKSFQTTFEDFYGDIQDFIVIGLLPSYLERKGSSLIYMVDDFIKTSSFSESGFYLDELNSLSDKLIEIDQKNKKILLIGVSFALLNLIEQHQFQLKNTIVMETGGMKGRRKEMIRKELHEHLSKGFGVENIHSEYGMTELLSQAYSKGKSLFSCPNHMKIMIRDPEDPFHYLGKHKTGGINVIDLANIHSCSFIATQDLGKKVNTLEFEILGRFDHSDIRGCNLMVL